MGTEGQNNGVPGGFAALISPTDTTSTSGTIPTKHKDVVTAIVAPVGTPNAGTVYLAGGEGANDGLETVAPDGTSGFISLPGQCTDVAGLAIVPAGTPKAGTVYATCTVKVEYEVAVIPPSGDSSVMDLHKTYNSLGGLAVAPAGVPNAGKVYVADHDTTSGSNSITVLSPAGAISTTIPVSTWTLDVAVAPSGAPNAGTIYATSDGGDGTDDVIPISPAGQPGAPLTVGNGASGIAIAADGSIFVANANQPGEVGVRAPSGTGYSIAVGDYAQELAIAPAGTPNAGTLYVANSALNGSGSVSVIAPGSKTETGRIVLPSNATPYGLGIVPAFGAPDGAGAVPSGVATVTRSASTSGSACPTVSDLQPALPPGADPSSIRDIQCSGGFAAAQYDSGGNGYIGVFKENSAGDSSATAWSRLDRAVACGPKYGLPAALRAYACTGD